MNTASDILKSRGEAREKHTTTLSDLVKNFENIFESIAARTDMKPLRHRQLSMPMPSRLHSHVAVPYKDVLGSLFRIVLCVAKETKGELEKLIDYNVSVVEKLSREFHATVAECNGTEDNLWGRFARTEHAVAVVEVLSLATILCAICAEMTRPVQQKKGKKNRPTTSSELRDVLMKFVGEVRDGLISVDKTLSGWEAPRNPSDLAERLGALSIADGDFNSVLGHLGSSHISAVKEMKAVLNCKIKYLNQLIC